MKYVSTTHLHTLAWTRWRCRDQLPRTAFSIWCNGQLFPTIVREIIRNITFHSIITYLIQVVLKCASARIHFGSAEEVTLLHSTQAVEKHSWERIRSGPLTLSSNGCAWAQATQRRWHGPIPRTRRDCARTLWSGRIITMSQAHE